MSALARLYLTRGDRVFGSDSASSDVTRELAVLGVKIYHGHQASHITPDFDLVVYTPAVIADNPELTAAKNLHLRAVPWQAALGELIKSKFTIAITGTHGKSTTTAMTALMLVAAGMDPTVIIGTKVKEFGNANFRLGRSDFFVIEADDFNRNFLYYYPRIMVITNIDTDHLDYYKTLDGVKQGFIDFSKNLDASGSLIINGADKTTRQVLRDLRLGPDQTLTIYNDKKIARHKLQVMGDYNQSNAEAAAQVGLALGIAPKIVEKSLSAFAGTWRRQELVAPNIYSDYAHHPTEIRASLKAFRETYPGKKLLCIFEPHQADRTKRLFSDFSKSFAAADEVIILPIHLVAGRDKKTRVTSQDLVKAIKLDSVRYEENFATAFKKARRAVASGSVVVFMGAGNIDQNLRAALSKSRAK